MLRQLPNILTGARLVLALAMFLALAAAGDAVPGVGALTSVQGNGLMLFAVAAFVIAAITDFFDGWAARKFNATSVAGAIMDPIADKILVCGALLGLLALGARVVVIPAGLILFREFAVSAMREVLAPRGLVLPVTFLAKIKTTLQLVAVGAIMALPAVAGVLHPSSLQAIQTLRDLMLFSYVLLWLAAAVTLWTGAQYALAARRALAVQFILVGLNEATHGFVRASVATPYAAAAKGGN